jgi:replication factor A1
MAHLLTTHRIVGLKGQESKPTAAADGKVAPLVLQAINIKTINTGNGSRLRIVLSDGEYFVQGMVASQVQVPSDLKLFSILQIDQFMVNIVAGNKTVFILLDMKVIDNSLGHKIGEPTNVEEAPVAAAAAAVPLPGATHQPLYNSTNAAGGAPPHAAKSTYDSSSNPYGGVGSGGSSNKNNNPYGRSPTANRHETLPPIVRSNAVATGITPIAALNMYNNRWTIQARLTLKSDIKTWSNSKGEGSLFSIELLDSSQDIRATFFKEAVDKFYNLLEVGKVYTLSGGRLKVANMQWNTCKSNFEITFDANAEIHLSADDGNIQLQAYDLVKIADIEQVEASKNIDVLAVVKAVSEPAHLVSKKSGQELTKCDLTLVDDSGVEINCTIWGDKANTAMTDFAGQPVVAFRRARVSDYGGKSLSAGNSIDVNPAVPQTQQLMQWWQTTGQSGAARSLSSTGAGGLGGGRVDSLSERKSISTIKDENLGMGGDKPDWMSFKATLSFLKKDKEGGAWYTACANAGEPCKNRFKVTHTTDGQWYCDKCQSTYPNPVRRWIFSGVVEDATSSTWVSFFNEQAETLFDGLTADQCYEQTHDDRGVTDQDAYDSVFAKALYKEFIFKCKVKNETHNDDSRVKTSVYSLHPVDYVKESNDLLAAIEQF